MNKKSQYVERFVPTALRLPVPYMEELKAIKKRLHISISEQIRSALRDYLAKMRMK